MMKRSKNTNNLVLYKGRRQEPYIYLEVSVYSGKYF